MIDLKSSIAQALRSKQRGFIINPYAYGTAAPSDPVDADFANVVLLLHGDGVDTSTTFVDTSTYHRTMTASNGAQIDTAQFKFGVSSMLFDGTNDTSNSPDAAELTLGTSDFTIECWLRINSVGGGGQSPFCQWTSSGNRAWGCNYNNASLQFFYTPDGSTQTVVTKVWAPSTGQWYHVAICRSGVDLRLFVDGTQLGTTHNISTTSIFNTTAQLDIGGNSTTGFVNGWLDDVRITVGTARYTANFAVPTAAFPDMASNTVTWNPLDKGTQITLSAGNLTATKGTADVYHNCRANKPRMTGKYYFEVKVDVGNTSPFIMVGVATGLPPKSATSFPASVEGWGYYEDTGNKYTNGGNAAYGAGYLANDIIGCAVDMTAGKVWWSKNNTFQASGNPGAGTNEGYSGLSGRLYPAIALYRGNAPAHVVTGRFKTSDFTYSPPSGFSAWGE